MTYRLILLATLVLWQVTPAYRARQLNSEGAEQLSRKEKQAPLIAAYAKEGLFLIDKGCPQEALAKIKQALDLDPANPSTQFDYALALRHAGRYDESIVAWQKLLSKQPDLPRAYYHFGYDYLRRAAMRKP
jgi:tetratricopeptide (TPR) repeat protein